MNESHQALRPGDIRVGVPLAFDVVGRDGRHLFTRGQVIYSDAVASDAAARGRKVAPRLPALPPFIRIGQAAARLGGLFNDLAHRRHRESWILRLRALAMDLQEAADDDPDATFAAAHLESKRQYDVVHALMAALVASRLGQTAEIPPDLRLLLTVGALVHDVGMLPGRRELEAKEIMTPAQETFVRGHPLRSVQALRALGVGDERLLAIVRDHHEYLDGSGYGRLPAVQIGITVRIMALADSFSAMLRARPGRPQRSPRQALANLYADPQGRYDRVLLTRLVRWLGVHPPGSVLRLESGPLAVILGRADGGAALAARLLTDAAGSPLPRPLAQTLEPAECEAATPLPPAAAGALHDRIRQCWHWSAAGTPAHQGEHPHHENTA